MKQNDPQGADSIINKKDLEAQVENVLGKKMGDLSMSDVVTAIGVVLTSIMKPLYEEQNKLLTEMTKEIKELSVRIGQREAELERIIDSVAKLKESFEESLKNIPDAIQQHPSINSLITTHRSAINNVVKQAYTDQLTGLFNRNYLNSAFGDEQGNWVGFSIDIDHFKKVNDTFGHAEGDEVLRAVADVVKKNTIYEKRKALAFRLGGEEIGVLVKVRSTERSGPFNTADEINFVSYLAEKIRADIQSQVKLPDGKSVTASIGVADKITVLPMPEGNFKSFDIFGDKNLYAAKEAGRNKVVIKTEALLDSYKKRDFYTVGTPGDDSPGASDSSVFGRSK